MPLQQSDSRTLNLPLFGTRCRCMQIFWNIRFPIPEKQKSSCYTDRPETHFVSYWRHDICSAFNFISDRTNTDLSIPADGLLRKYQKPIHVCLYFLWFISTPFLSTADVLWCGRAAGPTVCTCTQRLTSSAFRLHKRPAVSADTLHLDLPQQRKNKNWACFISKRWDKANCSSEQEPDSGKWRHLYSSVNQHIIRPI
jgi:hypothetical protein